MIDKFDTVLTRHFLSYVINIGNFMAGNFMAGNFMAGNFMAGNFLGRIRIDISLFCNVLNSFAECFCLNL